MKRMGWALWLLPRNIAIGFMRGYRKIISPLYGEVCRYYPSCSRYALESYQRRGFTQATALTVWRLLRCNPWTPGGVDDPPAMHRAELQLNRHGFVVWHAKQHETATSEER